MTKRARPHFRCLQYETGQPWILMEYLDGDNLDLFQKTIGFDLPKDTPLIAAEEVAQFLSTTFVSISET
jgi:hypothetical protein